MKKKKIIVILLSACLLIGSLAFLQALFMPKYVNDIIEGRLVGEYYENAKNNDVIFIGDCEVYENFSPITLYEKYGITSYIRGSSQQLMWQSYYLMEETLKYEKPKAFVFNILAMEYNEPQKEAYNRLTLDHMKWSKSKWDSIQASKMEDESVLSYLFPLLRYHSRWDKLTTDDLKYLTKEKKSFHNGYLMRVDIRPVEDQPTPVPLADYRFGDNSYEYLDKMVKLCKENDIELILIKAPSIYPYWPEQWNSQMEDYAAKNQLTYINFLEKRDEIGLDYSTDTYDNGLHLNLSGAEKLSTYFGNYLKTEVELLDRRKDKKIDLVWQKKCDFYHEMEADQYRELKEFGYLKSYGGKPPKGN